MQRAPWPSRAPHRPQQERVLRLTRSALRRLPVTAAGPRTVPVPTLAPRSRADALAAGIVVVATVFMLLALLVFSFQRIGTLAVPGKVFVGAIIGFVIIALLLFLMSLGMYLLPVLFGLRRPAPSPPPTWPENDERR